MKVIFVALYANGYIWRHVLQKIEPTNPLFSLNEEDLDHMLKKINLLIQPNGNEEGSFSILDDLDAVQNTSADEESVVIVNLTSRPDMPKLRRLAALRPICLVHEGDRADFTTIAPIFQDQECEIRYYTTGDGRASAEWSKLLAGLQVPDDRRLNTALHNFKGAFSWLILSLKVDASGATARKLLDANETISVFLARARQATRDLGSLANECLEPDERDLLGVKSLEVMLGVEQLLQGTGSGETRDVAKKLAAWINLYERLMREAT